MDKKRKRIARNQGRVEFCAHFEEIQGMLEQGYNKRNAHKKLLEDGLITMSYYAFCENYIYYSKKNNYGKAVCPSPASPVVKPPTARKPPSIIRAESSELQDPRTVDQTKFF